MNNREVFATGKPYHILAEIIEQPPTQQAEISMRSTSLPFCQPIEVQLLNLLLLLHCMRHKKICETRGHGHLVRNIDGVYKCVRIYWTRSKNRFCSDLLSRNYPLPAWSCFVAVPLPIEAKKESIILKYVFPRACFDAYCRNIRHYFYPPSSQPNRRLKGTRKLQFKIGMRESIIEPILSNASQRDEIRNAI